MLIPPLRLTQEQLASLEATFLQDGMIFHIQTWNALETRNVSWIASWTTLDSPATTFRMPGLYVQVGDRQKPGVTYGNDTPVAYTVFTSLKEWKCIDIVVLHGYHIHGHLQYL